MNETIKRADLPYVVEKMRLEDIPRVVEIERQAFPSPWPARAYRYEVSQNHLAHYFVACCRDEERPYEGSPEEAGILRRLPPWSHREHSDQHRIVGYCGFWVVAQEAHISTIAVDPQYRGLGIGQLLLLTAIEKAMDLDAMLVSLEVRVSNFAAQSLYRKYGFEVVGRRPRYYSDNREDALIMTADHITSAAYQRTLQTRRGRLFRRLERSACLTREEQRHNSRHPGRE
jgi:ribosomal-protein-alanine N-acetyltransferase